MPVFHSRILTGSDSFAGNRGDMLALVRKLREYEARAATSEAGTVALELDEIGRAHV